ncbi:class A beta-lactamase-related serine hydrolase [Stagnimonas aquatica]|uniref:Class A beta-lactamase-related serine hydrolase n=1 Tax=Stagnimonas aquatica TaxID=2689987 RepID=A0A3N0V7W7_9GAMM|nr:serine hydrolase domain-containing protein [Stagnimonas aquatica]ROH88721.1 class A beta-lactamase-related serine hydrolase [Stagnimonas aquatica]
MSGGLAARLDALFAPWNCSDEPGLVVALAQHGRLLYRRGFGLASLASGLALRPTSRLRIGSTSKPFTGLALAMLADEGRLDLDADLRRWLPELPDFGAPLSPRLVAQHRSGLRCHLDLWSITTGARARWPDAEPWQQLLRLRELNYPPGQQLIYSNGGYLLLARLIERVSELSFAEFLEQRIFRPLGMADTELAARDERELARQASLHVRRPEGGFQRGEMRLPMSGDGGLLSSADDLLRWLAELRRPSLPGVGRQLASVDEVVLPDGSPGDYGLGLIARPWRGYRSLGHPGAVMGGVSEAFTLPALGLDVVLLANRSDLAIKSLGQQVVDAVLGETTAASTLAAADQATRCGSYYQAEGGQLLDILALDGELGVDFGGARARLQAGEGGELCFAGSLGDFRFRWPEPDALEVWEAGVWRRYQRLGASPPATSAAKLAGSYRSAELAAEARVLRLDGRWCLGLQGRHGRALYALTARAPGVWSASLADGGSATRLVVEVLPGEGRAAGFTLSSLRSRKLRFERCRAGGPLLEDWG